MTHAAPARTPVSLSENLPLTCTRAGTCCHGKTVHINPYELAQLAHARNMTVAAFRDQFCLYGGALLAFNGPLGHKGQSACSQYQSGVGCLAHSGRPLACRLFPLGREVQQGMERYMHPGPEFPCLDGCPEVNNLPSMRVDEYLTGQQTQSFAEVQDAYLEVMQDLAEWGFVLLLETGLERSEQTHVIDAWQSLHGPDIWLPLIPSHWIDLLTTTPLAVTDHPPLDYVQTHSNLLQKHAQLQFGGLNNTTELQQASVLAIAISLHMGYGLGADIIGLRKVWVQTARSTCILG